MIIRNILPSLLTTSKDTSEICILLFSSSPLWHNNVLACCQDFGRCIYLSKIKRSSAIPEKDDDKKFRAPRLFKFFKSAQKFHGSFLLWHYRYARLMACALRRVCLRYFMNLRNEQKRRLYELRAQPWEHGA